MCNWLGDICENTATGMSLSVHGIQTYQNIISRVDKLEQVVNGQETRINKLATQLMALKPNFNLVDDNKYDPVCITDSWLLLLSVIFVSPKLEYRTKVAML